MHIFHKIQIKFLNHLTSLINKLNIKKESKEVEWRLYNNEIPISAGFCIKSDISKNLDLTKVKMMDKKEREEYREAQRSKIQANLKKSSSAALKELTVQAQKLGMYSTQVFNKPKRKEK